MRGLSLAGESQCRSKFVLVWDIRTGSGSSPECRGEKSCHTAQAQFFQVKEFTAFPVSKRSSQYWKHWIVAALCELCLEFCVPTCLRLLKAEKTENSVEEDSEAAKLSCLVIWWRKDVMISLCQLLPSGNCRIFLRSLLRVWLQWKILDQYDILYLWAVTVNEAVTLHSPLYIKTERVFYYFTRDIHQIHKLSRTWRLIARLGPYKVKEHFQGFQVTFTCTSVCLVRNKEKKTELVLVHVHTDLL